MFNPLCLINPELASTDPAEYALAHFAARTNWHRMFDRLPKVESSLGTNSSSVLRDFLIYCEENKIGLNWQRFLVFFDWLSSNSIEYDNIDTTPSIIDALKSTALAWANNHYVDSNCTHIVLVDKTTLHTVGAIRPAAFDRTAKIVLLSSEDNLAQSIFTSRKSRFAYGVGISWEINFWHYL